MAKRGNVCPQCGRVHGVLPDVVNKSRKSGLCSTCRRKGQKELGSKGSLMTQPIEKEKGHAAAGKELAQRLKELDERELRAFVGELSRWPELLEDISDMLDLALRSGEHSRDYSDFASQLNEDGLL